MAATSSFDEMYYRCNMTLPNIKALLTFDGFQPKFHSHPKNAVNSFGARASVYHCQNGKACVSLLKVKRILIYEMHMGLRNFPATKVWYFLE